MRVEVYQDFESLPAPVVSFLREGERGSFFYGIPWYRAQLTTASPVGDQPRLYAAEKDGRPVAALFTRERRRAGRLRAHMLIGSCHSMYTSDYGPILDAKDGLEGLREIAATIARASPAIDVVRFDSMDHDSPSFATLEMAFRNNGMVVQSFFNFGNWFENVEGLTIDGYLARRSPQTRYLIGRRVRKLARSGRSRFELVTDGPGLESALDDYEKVSAQSWKNPEPYPECIPEIVRIAAQAGTLRLGILYLDGEPAAAQIWIVSGGRATIFRLSYAKKFGHLSVGTVATWKLFCHAIEVDKVREIDFGRGDDDYKKKWLGHRRERWGMLAFNPDTTKGTLAALRHLTGHAAMSALRKVLASARNMAGISGS